MKPLQDATSIDAFANREMARYGSITEAFDHFPRLNDLDPEIPIEAFGEAWLTVAQEALEVMAANGDPSLSESFLSHRDRKPVNVLALLGGLTKLFIRVASYRQIEFADTTLWEFVACVHRWCVKDRSPAVFATASGLLNIAITELRRVSAGSAALSAKATGASLDHAEKKPTVRKGAKTIGRSAQSEDDQDTYIKTDKEPQDEKNRRVRDYLKEHPKASSERIEKATGIPNQTVRRLPAWKERPGKEIRRVQKKSVKAGQLTDKILASTPGDDRDPADVAEEKDEALSVARSRYVDTLTPRQRANFFKLTDQEQLDRIAGFLANQG